MSSQPPHIFHKYARISSLDVLIEINVINKVNSTFRIKMIVFPRYKIPRHYKFHYQRKIIWKKWEENIPEETTLSKPVGYFDFANIIWSCICIKLIIHYKTSITSNIFKCVHDWKYIYIIVIRLFFCYVIIIDYYRRHIPLLFYTLSQLLLDGGWKK